ncbi:MAG: serine/threonine-protein kinase [Elusimicrobiota bacterium]
MLLLGLLLIPLPAFSQGIDPVLKEMDAITSVEGPRLCEELRAYTEQLEALEPSYQDPSALDDAKFQRAHARAELERSMKDFRILDERFKQLGKTAQTNLALMAFRRKSAGKVDPRTSVFQTYAHHDAFRKLSLCYEKSYKAIQKNDELFSAAFQARAERKARIRIGLVVAGVILLCAGLPIFLARRMAARTVRQALLALPRAAAASKDDVGQVLAENIRLDRIIGQGGMGIVYEGTDLTLDRKVAVKRMRDEISENPRGLSQFLAEARSVAALKHPNIVEIYSILKERDRIYLVFEYVEGETLEHALAVNRKLTLEQSLPVLRQAAAALDYAHSRKVIHRDLKPSNIMLTPAGTARVMDFGLAYQAKKTIAMLTKAERWGTPAFMSPEQELGSIGNETDIYALGVCFYVMLTGTLPFPGPDHLAQKRAMKPAGAERLPAKLLPVMKKAFAVDPRQRHHSGAELVAAVENS